MAASSGPTKRKSKTFQESMSSLPTLLFIALLLFAPRAEALPTADHVGIVQGRSGEGSMPQEINPVTPKFKTVKDPDMPGYPDFRVVTEDNLASWNDDRLELTTTKFMPGMFQTRLGLANGYAGSTVAAAGPFFERDLNQTNHDGSQPSEGWPMRNPRQTFGTISGFFDCQATTPETNFEELRERGCESIISGTPHPLGLHLVVGDQVLNSTVDKSTISNFKQTMSYRDGVVNWKYTWSPRVQGDKNVKLDIEMTSFMHRTRPNVAASELKVTPRGGNYNVSIVDLLDGRSAVRSSLSEKSASVYPEIYLPENTIWVSNYPEGLPDIKAWTFSIANISNGYTVESSRRRSTVLEASDDMSIGQEWDVNLIDGNVAVFHKFVGLASSDKYGMEASRVAGSTATMASFAGWNALISEHRNAWNHLMAKDRILNLRDPVTGKLPVDCEHVAQLQIMHTTSHFYLLQNLLDNEGDLNDNSVSVGGLTSDTYGGMVFWDADFWMFPTILETNPDYATQIPKYRTKLYPQAKANTQEDYVLAKYKFDNESVLYSWTSGRYGNATGTGPVADYEVHLNAITAISMFQWLAVTGNDTFFRAQFWPVVNGIGHTITTLLQKDGDGYSIRNMTDPDEYANHVDNGAFTLAAFSQVLGQINEYRDMHNLPVNQTWVDMQKHINIPRDSATGITKEYKTMQNNITVKQADVTMLSYPLLVANYTLEDSIRDLHYYSQKQSADGPAMTNAIAAIAENRVAQSGCAAFTLDMQSSLPNLRAPWYQFSEQINDDANENGGTSPAFPFLTGHGGALQIPLYGYLGLERGKEGVTIRPSLPPPYTNMQLPEFYRSGNRFKASMNNTHTILMRLPNIYHSDLVDLYDDKKMPITVERRSNNEIISEKMEIAMNETLTVENDMYWTLPSTKNNMLQCQKAEAQSIGGQYVAAGAAVDGDSITYWQPASMALTNLTIKLSPLVSNPRFKSSTRGFQRVKQIRVEWGARVPQHARVILMNGTTPSVGNSSIWSELTNRSMTVDVARVIELKPKVNTLCDSTPIPKVDDETKIQMYRGNCTTVNVVEGIWSAEYSVLEIEGCQGCEGDEGATVGEFEVIGAES